VENYPGLDVRKYEVWKNEDHQKLFEAVLKAFGINRPFVPMIFIGDLDPVVVYAGDGSTTSEIEEKLQYCLKNRCSYSVGQYLEQGEMLRKHAVVRDMAGGEVITIPFLGKLNTSEIALPVFTVLLAFLDSFNPCAFFVITFLLSLLTHQASFRIILIIGNVFVVCSGLLYFVFMSAWFNLFFLTRNLRFITLVAGIVAIGLALVNIKDFWYFKKGISLAITERKKQVLFERIRALALSRRLPVMVASTILLAAGANSYEILCTAGFPLVYTKILTLRIMSLGTYYMYLAMYNLVYILPLVVIVFLFAVTLGSKKMTEWQGRVLKLASGLMMLALGSALIIKPSLLNSLIYSLLLVAGTVILAVLIAVAWKRWVRYIPSDRSS